MPRYKLVVMTRPVDGREKEFNDWYQDVHLRDLVAVDGIKSAQRFRLSRTVVPDPEPLPYLAIYDVETDDIDKTLEDLQSRATGGRMFISPALAIEGAFGAVYEELGPAVTR
jgi:hypothetical protein